jgi:hypothetical protein
MSPIRRKKFRERAMLIRREWEQLSDIRDQLQRAEAHLEEQIAERWRELVWLHNLLACREQ